MPRKNHPHTGGSDGKLRIDDSKCVNRESTNAFNVLTFHGLTGLRSFLRATPAIRHSSLPLTASPSPSIGAVFARRQSPISLPLDRPVR
jgi:hypothetical protein